MNPKNGLFLKHFWYALNILKHFLGSRVVVHTWKRQFSDNVEKVPSSLWLDIEYLQYLECNSHKIDNTKLSFSFFPEKKGKKVPT